MRDTNQIVVVARLGRDPELRSVGSGDSVCSLRVCVNSSRKHEGEWEDKPNWLNANVWGAQGEALARNLTKGSRVCIAGSLEQRTWEKDGQKRESVEIRAHSVQYLDPKGERPEGGGSSSTTASDDDIPF